MTLHKLVSTYEMRQVAPLGKLDFHCDLRIEVFESETGMFSCQVWIIEEYRIMPTNYEYNNLDPTNPDCYADKLLPAIFDTHGFDEIVCSDEKSVLGEALNIIRKLFKVDFDI